MDRPTVQGRWTREEDEALRMAVRNIGERWVEVEACVGRLARVRVTGNGGRGRTHGHAEGQEQH
jgi:hypothetical protein